MVIVDYIIKWAVPFICGGVISGAITYVKMYHKRNMALEDGMQCLLRAELLSDYIAYSRRGWCSNDEKESVNRMYKAYHALGGNDIITDKYSFIMSLPDEEPKYPDKE